MAPDNAGRAGLQGRFSPLSWKFANQYLLRVL